MRFRCIWLVVAMGYGQSIPSFSQTVFQVAVQESGAEVRAGVAVLVAAEAGAPAALLTSSGVVGSGENAQYVVLDSATGARTLGQLDVRSEETGLALLSVPGLGGTPAVLASGPSGEGRQVEVRLPDGQTRRGHLHSVVERAGQTLYRFTVRPEQGEGGVPVMNNCGEFLTISRALRSGGWSWADFGFGLGPELDAVKSFLAEQGVVVETSSDVCLSVEERLAAAEATREALEERQAELEEAAKKAEELTEKAEELTEKAERLAEIEAAKRRLETQLLEQQEELSQRQQELEQKEEAQSEWQEARRQQDLLLRYGGIAALTLLLGGGLVASLLLRARRRRLEASERHLVAAEEELARTNVSFPDLVLTGHGPDCGDVRLKVNGSALARAPNGQILGRSSAGADYVVDAGSVSRRHARLRVVNDDLLIEDLGSLNGTRVDGSSLKRGDSVRIRQGATLVIGDVGLLARFLGGKS